MIIALAIAALAVVLGGAAVPQLVQARRSARQQARTDAAQARTNARAATDREREAQAAATAATAATQTARANAESERVRRSPVDAVMDAALAARARLLGYAARHEKADRDLAQAQLRESRAVARHTAANKGVASWLDTPAMRMVMNATPYALAAVVVLETLLNYPIFAPVVGPSLALAVAPLAAAVLAVGAFWLGVAIRNLLTRLATGAALTYGTWLGLLGGGMVATLSVIGMVWLAPARSAGPHEKEIATAKAEVAQARTRAQEQPTAQRALADAEARLDDAQQGLKRAAETDRVIVLGSSLLGMGLVEMLLLGAPLRERRRAQGEVEDAEDLRLQMVEAKAAAKRDHRGASDVITNQMIEYLLGHGVAIEDATLAVEEASRHAQVLDVLADADLVTRAKYQAMALGNAGHTVVVGEVAGAADDAENAVNAGNAGNAAESKEIVAADPIAVQPAQPAQPAQPVGELAAELVAEPVDDAHVDLDAPDVPRNPGSVGKAGPAGPAERPTLDDLDQSQN